MANILIVDDEEMDRLLERTFLEDAGHTPFFAPDGEVALRVYQENDIDVVVTDLRMPNLNGLDLIRQLLEINPKVAVIAVSGVSADRLGEAEEFGAMSGLMKPVRRDQLVEAVEEALAAVGKDQDGDSVEGDEDGDVWGTPRRD